MRRGRRASEPAAATRMPGSTPTAMIAGGDQEQQEDQAEQLGSWGRASRQASPSGHRAAEDRAAGDDGEQGGGDDRADQGDERGRRSLASRVAQGAGRGSSAVALGSPRASVAARRSGQKPCDRMTAIWVRRRRSARCRGPCASGCASWRPRRRGSRRRRAGAAGSRRAWPRAVGRPSRRPSRRSSRYPPGGRRGPPGAGRPGGGAAPARARAAGAAGSGRGRRGRGRTTGRAGGCSLDQFGRRLRVASAGARARVGPVGGLGGTGRPRLLAVGGGGSGRGPARSVVHRRSFTVPVRGSRRQVGSHRAMAWSGAGTGRGMRLRTFNCPAAHGAD